MTQAHWEHFEHEADIGVRGIGPSLAEAFEQAALALTAIVTDPRHLALASTVEVTCEAPDRELLLVDWLNAIIYEMATRQMIFGHYTVRLDGLRLHARLQGEPLDVTRHQPAVEIKGATYTALSVRQSGDQWIAECVLDV